MEAVETVNEAVKLIILCLMTACLSLFLQKCFETGMIFRRYYLALVHIQIKSWRKKDRWKRWLIKPLGLCVYCNGTWLFIVLFFFTTPLGDQLFWIITGIGINYIWIKILEKL